MFRENIQTGDVWYTDYRGDWKELERERDLKDVMEEFYKQFKVPYKSPFI